VAQNDNGRNFVTYEQAAALLSTHGVQNSWFYQQKIE
jgi:hypothetical protein